MSITVAGVGEVLWDVLPGGRRLGGAPANFACHAMALGADAAIVSAVGDDPDGAAILDELGRRGFDTATLAVDPFHPTGTVTVRMGDAGQPDYTIHEDVAWDFLSPTPAALDVASNADAICFGSLAQRTATSREAVNMLLTSSPPGSLRIFDVNLRQNYYSAPLLKSSVEAAHIVKLNDDELSVFVDLLLTDGKTLRDQVASLAHRFDLQGVALTRGAGGSLLYFNGAWDECPSSEISELRDTVGAGDAFLAALVIGLLTDLSLEEINRCANNLAGHVCGCDGATPPPPAKIHELFRSLTSK